MANAVLIERLEALRMKHLLVLSREDDEVLLEAVLALRRPVETALETTAPDHGQQWKCGNEFLPFHPQASHVPPEYRDGWNRCYWMALGRGVPGTLKDQQEQPK